MSDPWVTKDEEEQISREYCYLNSVDPKTGHWRDLALMYFSPGVLEKYRTNSRCKIGKNYITFLAPRRDEDLTVNFEVINGKLMVQSKYFCFVPPRERKYWEKYRFPEEDNLFKDYKLK
jgi:hypothetical protein